MPSGPTQPYILACPQRHKRANHRPDGILIAREFVLKDPKPN